MALRWCGSRVSSDSAQKGVLSFLPMMVASHMIFSRGLHRTNSLPLVRFASLSAVSCLVSLSELVLLGNPLDHLPDALSTVSRLDVLDLRRTPLANTRTPRLSVCVDGSFFFPNFLFSWLFFNVDKCCVCVWNVGKSENTDGSKRWGSLN